MNAEMAHVQRIGRLTPLVDVLALIGGVAPVAASRIAVSAAAGRILAADVVAEAAMPGASVALRDGWAVDSEATRDAGPYAPMVLLPPAQRIDAFAVLPAGTDAVAPIDAVSVSMGIMQLTAPVAPGEGVQPAGGDAKAGAVLCEAGKLLRDSDIAVLKAAGVTAVDVRSARIRIAPAKPNDPVLDAIATFLAGAARSAGAIVEDGDSTALFDGAADAVITIGGTGSGFNDRAVTALSQAGTVACHGVGMMPGETAAFGHASGRPALLIPGRLDAALACWCVLGEPLVARLCGRTGHNGGAMAMLSRKVTSSVGMTEFVLVRRAGDRVTPLASGLLPLQALTLANGWLLVPAESEGYPADSVVHVRPLP